MFKTNGADFFNIRHKLSVGGCIDITSLISPQIRRNKKRLQDNEKQPVILVIKITVMFA